MSTNGTKGVQDKPETHVIVAECLANKNSRQRGFRRRFVGNCSA